MSKTTPSRTLADVLAGVDELWPLSGTEDWDAAGLVVGDPAANISAVHLMVDVTVESVAEALKQGADLIIAHHPLLLRGVTTVAESTYKGNLIATLIRGGCALYAAHTNADAVPTGTSARLAELLELEHHAPLTEGAQPGHGLGGGRVLVRGIGRHTILARQSSGYDLRRNQ